MSYPFTVFIPYSGNLKTWEAFNSMRSSNLIEELFLVTLESAEVPKASQVLISDGITSSKTLRDIAGESDSEYILLLLKPEEISFGRFSLNRLFEVAEMTGAALVYSDFQRTENNISYPNPLIDYQPGSIRDDFDFGSVVVLRKSVLADFLSANEPEFIYAGFYNLRLFISRNYGIRRIPEFLYSVDTASDGRSDSKQFAYLDPGNRKPQIEMEEAASNHLKLIGAFLEPVFSGINLTEQEFAYTASVIIPVKNREKTIAEAVNSAVNQVTKFPFNVIVVDNHSTDGTTEIVRELCSKHSRIIHLIPESQNLNIGGCWNEAIFNEHCGKYAVQLDSDDLYADEHTLQKIINVFSEEKSAMVIGSYKLTDFNKNEIPPGIIDHREWTRSNGRNNALRINGLGAPRAFFTPILRKNKFPDVSYGEDYAVSLAISRKYEISRIFEPLYVCRRWEGNSDSQLTVEKKNNFNFYKDSIRTYEIKARQKLNAEIRK